MGASAALALGAVACEVDEPVDPGIEDEPLLEEEGFEDGGQEEDDF